MHGDGCSVTSYVTWHTGQSEIMSHISYFTGYAVAQLVEALRYKPEGRGFDSR